MYLLLSVITSFLVTFILLPIIIKVSRSIDLLDSPDRRKIHRVSTPSLGGIGIFVGFLLAMFISIPLADLTYLKFFLSAIVLIFILGIRDDVSSLQARHKLLVQILSAVLIVYFSGIHLEGLYGLFGVGELPDAVMKVVTVIMIVILTNSFNLIDGIDGLAGSVATLILFLFGWFFLEAGFLPLAVICLSVSGSLIAFLFYNWFPSKVFMGDTGSMLVGFIITVLSVVFLNNAQGFSLVEGHHINAPVALVLAALVLPVYDTLRVFTIRLSKGQSPLVPDRNHIHHGLLKLGLNHAKATLILVSFNALTVVTVFVLNDVVGRLWLILFTALVAVSFGAVVDILGRKRKYLGASAKVSAHKGLYVSKSA